MGLELVIPEDAISMEKNGNATFIDVHRKIFRKCVAEFLVDKLKVERFEDKFIFDFCLMDIYELDAIVNAARLNPSMSINDLILEIKI